MLMNADRGGVDYLQVAIKGRCYRLEDTVPHTQFPPSNKLVVAGRCWAITFGDFRLGRSSPKPPEHAIEHLAIICEGTPCG